jgi:hypothetical protein
MPSDSDIDWAIERLANLYWHDSMLLQHHVLRRTESRGYDVRLDFDFIQSYGTGKPHYAPKSLILRDCQLIQLELDLFGLTFTNGRISEATFCRNFAELDPETQKNFRRFDLQNMPNNPIRDCFYLQIELIPPGGSIALFAKQLQEISDPEEFKR